MFKIRSAILSTFVLGLVAGPLAANAVTYVQTSDDCTGGCGISSLNRIDVTAGSVAGTTDIKLSLTSGFGLVNTGANGSGGSFNFGLTSPGSLIFTAVTPAAFTANGIEVQGGAPATGTTSTASSAAISAPGKFNFANGYALTNFAGNGASNPYFGTLEFTVNQSLATFLSLLALSGGSTFFLDVVGSTGRTGIIDFTVSQVPIPGAALLFGSALVGMGFLSRRRRNKNVDLVAA
jgi:hypothetical protein